MNSEYARRALTDDRRGFLKGVAALGAIAVVGVPPRGTASTAGVFASGTVKSVAHLVMAHVDYPDDDARMWAGGIHAYTAALAGLLIWRRDTLAVALDASGFREYVEFRKFLALVRTPAIPGSVRRNALAVASCGFGIDLYGKAREPTLLYFGYIACHLARAADKIIRA